MGLVQAQKVFGINRIKLDMKIISKISALIAIVSTQTLASDGNDKDIEKQFAQVLKCASYLSFKQEAASLSESSDKSKLRLRVTANNIEYFILAARPIGEKLDIDETMLTVKFTEEYEG